MTLNIIRSIKNFFDEPLYSALIKTTEEESYFFMLRYVLLFNHVNYGEQNRWEEYIKREMKKSGFPENPVELRFYSRHLKEETIKIVRID